MGLKPILIDTNAYSAFKQGVNNAVTLIQHVSSIIVCSIVLGELLSGFALSKHRQANQHDLKQFITSPRVRVLNVTAQTATHYAQIYQDLRQKGRPIPTNDMWIAALALEQDYAVFTLDQHFTQIDDLAIVSNLEDLVQVSQ